jgi:peptidoglycan biosynthesis protein MviN/MurJ (putative lipid II flippase)
MLRSTVGTWVNYATTALFQVLFARRFGAAPAASAYALTFTVAVGVGAIFVGMTQVIYLPRLLSRSGELLTAVLLRMGRLTWLALVTFAILAVAAPWLTPVIAPSLGNRGVHLVALTRLACLFGFTQVLVGQLAVLCWARGARFIPAVAPVCPSLIASIPLLANGHSSTVTIYVLLTAGSLLQLTLLSAAGGRGLRLSQAPYDREGEPPTGVSLGTFAAAQLIAPFEVAIAAHASATGGADFNYGYRAIVVAQALMIGGVVSAALPDWSNHVRAEERVTLEHSVARTAAIAALALSAAAAVGLVASDTLVRIAFQRGSFTPHDTEIVASIVAYALVGFVAEGIMLVLSQAILAGRLIRAAMIIGMSRAAAIVVLVAVFGLAAGPVGVAVGYSVASVITLVAEVVYVCRKGLVSAKQLPLARSTLLVMACTCLTAALVRPVSIPPLLRIGLVLAVFVTVIISVRDRLPKIRTSLP